MSEIKETNDCWVIKNAQTDDVVFNYRTHQSNVKKGIFNSYKYAEEALKSIFQIRKITIFAECKGVTTMPNELKPCPFCGGKAELHYQPLYTDNGVCVRCIKCRARSRFILYDCKYDVYHGEKKVYISKERATNDAINTWNRRC